MKIHESVGATEVWPDVPVQVHGIEFTLPSKGVQFIQSTSAGVTWSWVLRGFFAYPEQVDDLKAELKDGGECTSIVAFCADRAHLIVIPDSQDISMFHVAIERPDLTAWLSVRKSVFGQPRTLRVKLMSTTQVGFVAVGDHACRIDEDGHFGDDSLADFGVVVGHYAARTETTKV